jgi:hypothetical protein
MLNRKNQSDAPARFWAQVEWDIDGDESKYPKDGTFESILKDWEARPDAKMAKVKIKLGNTINIGEFSSVRVDVGVELPSGVGEIEDAYEFGEKFCKSKLKRVTESVENSMGTVDSFAELVESFGEEADRPRNRRRGEGRRRSRRRTKRSNHY